VGCFSFNACCCRWKWFEWGNSKHGWSKSYCQN
jgi:hypothetical protein